MCGRGRARLLSLGAAAWATGSKGFPHYGGRLACGAMAPSLFCQSGAPHHATSPDHPVGAASLAAPTITARPELSRQAHQAGDCLPRRGPPTSPCAFWPTTPARSWASPWWWRTNPALAARCPRRPCKAPRPMATRWRRFRWACSACPTPPRSTGTRSRTSAMCSTSPATPLVWWCPDSRSRPGRIL